MFSAKELENISEKEADKRKYEEITVKNGLYTKISASTEKLDTACKISKNFQYKYERKAAVIQILMQKDYLQAKK